MDNTNMMKAFMLLADITEATDEEKVESQARIVFATPGIIKPDNWDALPLEEKQKRLDRVKAL